MSGMLCCVALLCAVLCVDISWCAAGVLYLNKGLLSVAYTLGRGGGFKDIFGWLLGWTPPLPP